MPQLDRVIQQLHELKLAHKEYHEGLDKAIDMVNAKKGGPNQ